MNNIQEWAEFYFNKGINVIPDNEHFEWSDWRHKKQTIEELRGYDWASAKDIYAVVGKKGIRVLSLLRVENESVNYRDLLVERAISLLGLPYDYPWVVDYGDAICVFVESADDIQGMKNQKYSDIELLWQDTLCLPLGGSIHFYWGDFYGGLPQKRPAHISNDLLLKCLETLRKDIRGESEWPCFCGQIRPESLPILDDFKHLSLVSKYDDANKLMLGFWYIRWDGPNRIYIKGSEELIEHKRWGWRTINATDWSFEKRPTKKNRNKYYLHIKGNGTQLLDIGFYIYMEVLYLDEHIIYGKTMGRSTRDDKVFFIKEDSVDLFKNNDDIVSYFSQIENRGKLQMENNKNLSENKTGCLAIFSVVVLILTILLV